MKYLSAFLLFIPVFLHGQQIDRQVFPIQGGFEHGETMTVSWTLGEIIAETVYTEDKAITQGFQQPDFTIELIDQVQVESLPVKLYPNPTQGRLTLQLQSPIDRYLIEIVDLQGSIIHRSWNQEMKTELDLTRFPSGQYVIRVSEPRNHKFTIYHITKI